MDGFWLLFGQAGKKGEKIYVELTDFVGAVAGEIINGIGSVSLACCSLIVSGIDPGTSRGTCCLASESGLGNGPESRVPGGRIESAIGNDVVEIEIGFNRTLKQEDQEFPYLLDRPRESLRDLPRRPLPPESAPHSSRT